MGPLSKRDPSITGYHLRAPRRDTLWSQRQNRRILNSGKVVPALHIDQLVDFLYSVLYELLEFPVRLDLIELCGAVSPAEGFF